MMCNDDKNNVDSYEKILFKRCAKEGGHKSFMHQEGLISNWTFTNQVMFFFQRERQTRVPLQGGFPCIDVNKPDKVTRLVAPKYFFVACYLKKESGRDWEQDWELFQYSVARLSLIKSRGPGIFHGYYGRKLGLLSRWYRTLPRLNFVTR